MIPMILMAIEDDADRAFMINLYEQCHKAMYRQAYDILRDHGEAEDAVQDTLVKLIGRMAALRTMPQGQLLPYAVIAAKSTAIDRWRRRKKERVGASEDFAEGWSAAPEEQLGAFIDMERVDLLSRGLEKLPQRDRDILMYRYILEMSDEEIAGLLNIKPGSVRMCLSRARKNAFAVLEAEELLLKLALFHYLERENDRLRARMQEQPDPPEDRESAEHAVDRAMRRQRWQVIGQKAWQVSGRVVTRVAVVFLTFFICLSTAFAVSPSVRSAVYKMIISPQDRFTNVTVAPHQPGMFIDADLYTWEHCFAPTYLPEGYELAIFEDLAGIELLVSYEKGDKYMDFTQTSSGTHCSVHVDSENAQITRPIMIGYSEGIYNLKDGETSIVWQVGESMLSLLSNEDTEEVIKIAESIQLLR